MRLGLWLLAMVSAVCPREARPADNGHLETFMVPLTKPVPDIPAVVSSVGGRVAIVGNCVLLADGYAGLSVYEVGPPGGPRLIAVHPTGQYARTVQTMGDWAYVSDSLRGLVVFDLTHRPHLQRVEPTSALLQAWFQRQADHAEGGTEPGHCLAAVVDQRVYLARDDWGVVEIEMRSPRDVPPPALGPRAGRAIVTTVTSDAERRPEVTVSLDAIQIAADHGVLDWATPADRPAGGAIPQTVAAKPLTLSSRYENGMVRLLITGSAGQKVRIQQTTSIDGEWEEWGEVLLSEPELELPLGQTAETQRVFYRAVSP